MFARDCSVVLAIESSGFAGVPFGTFATVFAGASLVALLELSGSSGVAVAVEG